MQKFFFIAVFAIMLASTVSAGEQPQTIMGEDGSIIEMYPSITDPLDAYGTPSKTHEGGASLSIAYRKGGRVELSSHFGLTEVPKVMTVHYGPRGGRTPLLQRIRPEIMLPGRERSWATPVDQQLGGLSQWYELAELTEPGTFDAVYRVRYLDGSVQTFLFYTLKIPEARIFPHVCVMENGDANITFIIIAMWESLDAIAGEELFLSIHGVNVNASIQSSDVYDGYVQFSISPEVYETMGGWGTTTTIFENGKEVENDTYFFPLETRSPCG